MKHEAKIRRKLNPNRGRDFSDGIAIWTVRESNPGVGEIFRTRPDLPWGPSFLSYNVYWVSSETNYIFRASRHSSLYYRR